jgi:hypothetical protein
MLRQINKVQTLTNVTGGKEAGNGEIGHDTSESELVQLP